MLWEKARWKLCKGAAPCFEQTLKATKQQLYGHLPPITLSIHEIQKRHVGHCWRSKDEHINDVLPWIFIHVHTSFGRPAKRCQHHFCADTWCRQEDLLGEMAGRKRGQYWVKRPLKKGYIGYYNKLHLMVRLKFWRFGKCRVRLHCQNLRNNYLY